jgi:hypothetical protein
MRLTRKAVISTWFLVVGLFALSGFGMMSASVLLLVVGGLGHWRSSVQSAGERAVPLNPQRGLMKARSVLRMSTT